MTVIAGNEEKNIEKTMRALMLELSKLAPNPDKPKSLKPEFVKVDSQYEPAAEYDGMLGSMMLEGMLGMAFGQAAANSNMPEWVGDIDIYADAASDYFQSRPQRVYKLGQRGAITCAFNGISEKAFDAYARDLPRRMGIERWLAEYQRKLYALRKKQRLGLAC